MLSAKNAMLSMPAEEPGESATATAGRIRKHLLYRSLTSPPGRRPVCGLLYVILATASLSKAVDTANHSFATVFLKVMPFEVFATDSTRYLTMTSANALPHLLQR